MKVTFCLSREFKNDGGANISQQSTPGSSEASRQHNAARQVFHFEGEESGSGSSPIAVAGGVCRELALTRRSAVSSAVSGETSNL